MYTQVLKSRKSSKLAPAVKKKRSSQSLKPNDKHNIYKFHFVSPTLKKMYSLLDFVLLSLQLASVQCEGEHSSVQSRQGTEHHRGRMNPVHLAFVVHE